MRLTLPRLDTTDPGDLLAGLRGTAPLPGGDAGPLPGRLSSLGACISYSFAHLSGQARRLLPALSLFHGIADEGVLTVFSSVEGVPGRFAGVSQDEWTAVLQDAARVGLVTGIGAGMYRIHPALPGYLAAGWHAEDPSGYGSERDACEQALRAACAAFSRWLTGQIESGDAAFAYTIIGLQRRTLGAMLGHALDHHAWDHADRIVRALDAYWDTRGLGGEAAAWADRILAATTGHGQGPTEPASSLWLYTTIEQATRQNDSGRPDQAEQAYRRALAWLQDQPETDWVRDSVPVIYHQLGRTAQDRGRLEDAEDWYRKSLTINEELGNLPHMATSYATLGLLAEARDQTASALEWNIRCVTLFSEFPSPLTEAGAAALTRLTRQLGMPALEEAWQQATGQPLPQAVRDYVTSDHDQAQPGGNP